MKKGEIQPAGTSGPLVSETGLAQGRKKVPRILLAEDDPCNRKAFGLLLRLSHLTVDYAEDGVQAVEMCVSNGYDLVLMDANMPRLDGFGAARAIRTKELECGAHTPIIAITALDLKDHEESFHDAGFDAYISKPIDFEKCLQLVHQLIAPQCCDDNA